MLPTIPIEGQPLGANPQVARQAVNGRRWRRNSAMHRNAVLTLKRSDTLGVPRLS
jgi:hypothetical protein